MLWYIRSMERHVIAKYLASSLSRESDSLSAGQKKTVWHELGNSLLCSQKPATVFYSELSESVHTLTFSLSQINLMLCSHLYRDLVSGIFI